MEPDSSELDELERQLSHPYGAKALEVADMMHATNIGMTQATIDALQLQTGQQVLELGHGNAAHLPWLLGQAPGLQYTGLDVSEAMHAEAAARNAAAVLDGSARFRLYDGVTVPFDNDSFNCSFGVNTIYFWQDPQALLRELHRVLRHEGLLAVTFAHKTFMEKLPFVRTRFRLFDEADFTALARASAFRLESITKTTERVQTRTGELVERDFCIGLLRKLL